MNCFWFLQVTLLVQLNDARVVYPIIEYSYEDDTGSGIDANLDTYNEHNTPFLTNVIQKGKSPNKNERKLTTMEELQLLNRGVKLSRSKPGANLTSLPNESIIQLQGIECTENKDCSGNNICNTYTKRCTRCRIEKDICRQSENCCGNRKCIWGRCIERDRNGNVGSFCDNNKDCGSGLCCAREHGQSICKKYLALGEECELSMGGLLFSLTHKCPCAVGLNCKLRRKKKNQHQRTCVK